MKKLIFFLSAFALLAANAVAQPESMFGERTTPMTGKVVRAWDAGDGLISSRYISQRGCNHSSSQAELRTLGY